ncbi:MAG: glycosyltransferase [Propioniciclava sp.]
MTRPRIAIAHDYLTQRGGAERVVLSLLEAFPDAPVYTTLYAPERTFPEFRDAHIITSGLNRIRAFRNDHRRALPFLAAAADELRIPADIVVASSTGWAHGFPTRGRKLVYCHSPARYLYLTEEYLGTPAHTDPVGLGLLALRPGLIRWDRRAAGTAERYLCNSTVVRERIRQVYGITAAVVPPPPGVTADQPTAPVPALADWAEEGWFTVVSRLLPYKNVHHVVEAFRDLPDKLVIVGSGPLRDELVASAPANVRLLEGLTDAQLRWIYTGSRSLIAASHEDFGLTPVEAGLFGKPCLALRAGGYLDTIAEGVNGIFFDSPNPGAITEGVRRSARRTWSTEAIRAHADQFSSARFRARLQSEVAALV